MLKTFLKIILPFFLIAVFIFPQLAAANSALDKLENVGAEGENAPYMAITDSNSLAGIVGIGIQAFLGLLGVIFLILMLYAGYNWMMARGDEEKVTKAKDTITRAIIGLLITIGAYAISFWVFDKLLSTTSIIN